MAPDFALSYDMARRRFIPHASFPYHITARAHNREHYPLPQDQVWEILCEYLWLTHMKYDLRIHAFVLMPNHFHLIAHTPHANLDRAMNYFMSSTSKVINSKSCRINQLHGGRHFKCLISSTHYAHHVYKYVYRNPVKAGLCSYVEAYPFSTLAMFLGQQPMRLPLEADDMLMNSINKILEWLNCEPSEKDWDQMRRGLKHAEFALPIDPSTRRPSRLEKERL